MDRGAVLAAKEAGLDWGGWIPKGRRAEDGQVPLELDRYTEHPNPSYTPRTYCNVRDSDATLLITKPLMGAGSKITLEYVRDLDKKLLVLHAEAQLPDAEGSFRDACVRSIVAWITDHQINVLNVAGTRESHAPGIQERVRLLIKKTLEALS